MTAAATLPALVATLALACGALAAKPYKGRFYKGTTSEGTPVRLKVSRGGRWAGRFDFGSVAVQCDTAPPGDLTEIRLAYPGVLRINRRGGFAGQLPNPHTNEGAIVIRGRFVRRGTVRGTVFYHDRGCIGQSLRWRARVVPPASVRPPG